MRGHRQVHKRWGISARLSLMFCILVYCVLLVPSLSLADPAVDATLTDTPSMSPVGLGDTIDYTADIVNSGNMSASGVMFSDQSGSNNTTLTSLQTTPLCQDDSGFSTSVNQQLTSTPTSVLDNDTDPDGTGAVCIVSGGGCIGAPLALTSTNNGNVTLNIDGTFVYDPPLGFVGIDTFAYMINDVGGNHCLDALGATTSATVSIDVLSGGALTIIKEALPEGSTPFSFTTTGTGLSNFDLIDDGTATDRMTVSDLLPGMYTVTELVPAGWELSGLNCVSMGTGTSAAEDPANQTATIVLTSGGSVTCTFTDTQQATLTIVKEALPEGSTVFPFTTTGTGLMDFDLIDDGTATDRTTFTNLSPGSFTVTETVPAGWQLTNLSCTSLGTGTSTTPDPANQTTSITLVAISFFTPCFSRG